VVVLDANILIRAVLDRQVRKIIDEPLRSYSSGMILRFGITIWNLQQQGRA
jgi:hypothetical protein